MQKMQVQKNFISRDDHNTPKLNVVKKYQEKNNRVNDILRFIAILKRVFLSTAVVCKNQT